jgi:hypothetical protein
MRSKLHLLSPYIFKSKRYEVYLLHIFVVDTALLRCSVNFGAPRIILLTMYLST